MKKIKVAVISGFYPGGGVVTYVRNLYSHLNRSEKFDFDLFLDSPDENYDKLIKSYFPKNLNVKIFRVPHKRFFKGFIFIAKLLFNLKYKKYDFIEVHHTTYANVFSFFIPKEKFVIITHGPDVLDERMKKPLYKYLAKRAYRKSLAIATHTHKEIAKIVSLGVSKEKIIFFPCGVNIKEINNHKKINLRKELGIKNKYVLCTTYGKNYERKGTNFLLEALPEIMEEDISVILTGQMSKEMLPKIKRVLNKYKGRFFWVGFRNDIPNILHNSDLYILPSLMEGMSVSLLEAMAAGKACIATRNVGENEYSLDGAGVLINPKSSKEISNAVKKLVKNPKIIKKYSKRAKKRAGYFSWEKIAKQEEKFLENLIKIKNGN